MFSSLEPDAASEHEGAMVFEEEDAPVLEDDAATALEYEVWWAAEAWGLADDEVFALEEDAGDETKDGIGDETTAAAAADDAPWFSSPSESLNKFTFTGLVCSGKPKFLIWLGLRGWIGVVEASAAGTFSFFSCVVSSALAFFFFTLEFCHIFPIATTWTGKNFHQRHNQHAKCKASSGQPSLSVLSESSNEQPKSHRQG